MGKEFYQKHLKIKDMDIDYLEEVPFIRFQSKIFGNRRVLSFYRQQVCLNELKKFNDEKTENWKKGLINVLKKIFSGIFFIPVFKKQLKGKILKELVWGFNKEALVDNYLVDGKNLKEKDMVYYKSFNNTPGRKKAYIEAKKKGLKVVNPNRYFNLNKVVFYHIWYNFFCGIASFFSCLIHSRELLPQLAFFLGESNNFFRLFSLVDVDYYMGHDDRSGLVPTIVANIFDVRTFIYPWSDLTVCCKCDKQDIGYNDLFLWEKKVLDFQYSRNSCDNIFIIGCRFSDNYNKKSKNEIREKIGFPKDKKIVTFYDSSYSKKGMYSKEIYNDFIKVIKDFANKNPEFLVFIKPKGKVKKKYKDILKKANVKILDSEKFFITDVICSSDVNVGMGMNSTVTISLLCGVDGLYYDRTENIYHPLAKNKDVTFRDKERLFNQIEDLLKGNKKLQKTKLINEPYLQDTESIKLLHDYILGKNIDKKFKLEKQGK